MSNPLVEFFKDPAGIRESEVLLPSREVNAKSFADPFDASSDVPPRESTDLFLHLG